MVNLDFYILQRGSISESNASTFDFNRYISETKTKKNTQSAMYYILPVRVLLLYDVFNYETLSISTSKAQKAPGSNRIKSALVVY